METINLRGENSAYLFQITKKDPYGLHFSAEKDGRVEENILGATATVGDKKYKAVEQRDERRMKPDGSHTCSTIVLMVDANDESRQIEFAAQRRETGFSDDELWSLDASILRLLIPRLERFAEKAEYVIVRDGESKPLREIVGEIVAGFKAELDAFDGNCELQKEENEKFSNAKKLFWEYFSSLWI